MSIAVTDKRGWEYILANPQDYKPADKKNPLVILWFRVTDPVDAAEGGEATPEKLVNVAIFNHTDLDACVNLAADALFQRGFKSIFVPKKAVSEAQREARARNKKSSKVDWVTEAVLDMQPTPHGLILESSFGVAPEVPDETLLLLVDAAQTWHRVAALEAAKA